MRVKHRTFTCEKFQFGTDNTAVFSEHMRETHRIYKCRFCAFTGSLDKDFKCKYCGTD